MSDIAYGKTCHEVELPDGSGIALAILGSLGMLPLVLAALFTGKSMWIVFALWALGGPAIVFSLAAIALLTRSAVVHLPGFWVGEYRDV